MKRYLVWAVTGMVLVAGAGYMYAKYKRPAGDMLMSVIEVKKKDYVSKVSVTGSLNPRIEITLTSSKAGQVEEIFVHEGAYVKKGQTLATVSSEDRINLLNAASKNLEQAKLSGDSAEIASATDELRIAEAAYQKVPIISPIDGLVTLRNVEPGQKVATTTTILQVSDELVAKVLVDETDIGKIREGMKADIVIDAYPDEPVTGEIIKIAYTSTTESNVISYEVLLKLASGKGKLFKSGMTADVNITVKEKKGVIMLASDAVKERGGQKMTMVMGQDGRPEPRAVTTGIEDDTDVEIVSGLEAGDKVIVMKKASSSTSTASASSSRKNDMGGPPMMMGAGGPPR